MIKTMAFATLLAFPVAAQANDDPLDKALDACMNEAMNTLQIRECNDTAAKGWDNAMNQAYQKAMSAMDDKQKAKLRDAQRSWLTYRDSWIEASKAQFSDGTIASVQIGAQWVMLNKNQALMLRSLEISE